MLGGPDAPRLLLLATWQSEAGDEAPMVASLRALAATLPAPRAVEIALQPLGATEARARAEALLGADAARRAADLAAESDGSPFFVVELARWAQAAQHP